MNKNKTVLTEFKTTFGMTRRDIETVSAILSEYPDVTEVYVFGSRAKGTQKPSSDIDLAVMNGGVSDRIIRHIKADLEESTLPYRVDIINYPLLTHPELKEHIKRVGLPIYKRVA